MELVGLPADLLGIIALLLEFDGEPVAPFFQACSTVRAVLDAVTLEAAARTILHSRGALALPRKFSTWRQLWNTECSASSTTRRWKVQHQDDDDARRRRGPRGIFRVQGCQHQR